ncbi:hypothetical protein MES4922_80049 [Mesorhizobium ventifaucium]|uniref:Uncharacterized protein n=1 Tax=Mesorhizobium ventifaucium TaxID=666020 RepID=A0ABN8KBL8_9HYPH|nr:hypothetical protein MES4922_80049 [Mesorhizobium ventifaucium]
MKPATSLGRRRCMRRSKRTSVSGVRRLQGMPCTGCSPTPTRLLGGRGGKVKRNRSGRPSSALSGNSFALGRTPAQDPKATFVGRAGTSAKEAINFVARDGNNRLGPILLRTSASASASAVN